MAVRVAGKNIDEKYSKLVEPNLYYDAIMRPGVTYTDKYKETDAGVIYVHKLGAKTITPAVPGGDYVDSQTQDSLIQIAMNNEYKYSEKISQIAEEQTGYDIGTAEMEDIVKSCQTARDISGLACLANEGTAITSSTALTAANIKSQIIAVRTVLAKAKVKPDVVLCSADTYGLILEAAGTQYTPVTNDKTVTEGKVGRWLGFEFVEAAQMQETAAKYYDSTGVLKTIDLSGVDFIMYNKDALSILDTLTNARVVDSEMFLGKKVQVNIVSGFKVTNSACVGVRSTGS